MRLANSTRLAAGLAALTVTALLASCGGGTNAVSGDSKTLTLASVDQGSVEAVVSAFEKANPGVKVRYTTSGADQYQQQIRTQLSSGTAPDVMTVWPGNGNPGALDVLVKPGYLLDLSDQPWAAGLPPAVARVAGYQGKTYDALFGTNALGVVYNQQALRKSGLTPPTTWTQLLTFCRAAAARGTPAFALGNQTNWVTQLVAYALVADTTYAGDPQFDQKLQNGQASFARSGWNTAFTKYLDMNRAGCFQKDPLGTSYEATQQLAATGKALGLVQGNWVISLLKQQNPNASFTVEPLPATDTPVALVPDAAGAGYGINAKTKHKALALKFINYIMSPAGMKLFCGKQGSLPSLPGTGYTPDPALTDMMPYITGNKIVPFMDQLWPNAKVQQTMFSGIQDMFAGRSAPDKVLTAMDAAYRSGT